MVAQDAVTVQHSVDMTLSGHLPQRLKRLVKGEHLVSVQSITVPIFHQPCPELRRTGHDHIAMPTCRLDQLRVGIRFSLSHEQHVQADDSRSEILHGVQCFYGLGQNTPPHWE